MTMLSILFLILVMAVYVFTFPAYRAEQVMTVFFGFFYVAVMLSFVYQTRMLADGGVVVWLIFLSSWGCDTCAYCVGMLIGKHKMAPRLSLRNRWKAESAGWQALLFWAYCSRLL